jgi:hypothetical protein
MFAFLSNNMGTILTILILLVIVTAAILKIFWVKKKTTPAGACANCPCSCGLVG